MDIEKLKNEIALKHGYQDGILGSSWNYAMLLTHRTKRQIALYEEVIEALANGSHDSSGLHKHGVNGSALDATLTIKQATEAMIKFGEAARKWLDSEDGKKVTDAVKNVNQHCR